MYTHNEEQEWQTHSFYGMGSHMNMWLAYGDEREAQEALVRVEAMFRVAEARLTRFTDRSELALLNRRAGEWVAVSNVMWEVVEAALELAEETNGLFDPTMLKALVVAGYDRPFGRLAFDVASVGETAVSPHPLNWQHIELDPSRQAILLPEGMQLDLGGIGKGFTAQKAVEFLSQWGPCLIDAGGDLVAGDGPDDWPGWPVAIAAPWTSHDVEPTNLLRLWLNNATLATSGIDHRRWQRDGTLAHHLIDPHTQQPAETDVLTVSVLADDACNAEAWATAVLIAGVEKGCKAIIDNGLSAAFIDQQGGLTLTESMRSQVEFEGDALMRLS